MSCRGVARKPACRIGFRRAVALAAAFVIVLAAAAAAAELRTWTASTGKFTLKAKFVALADGKVTLEREDGSQVEIELAKLSAADRKYVEDVRKQADNPFKAKEETPFKAKSAGRRRPAAPPPAG